MKTVQERFWSKVNKTDTCWLWTGSLNNDGYGNFWDGKIVNKAHRFVFELYNGAIPKDYFVCHKCDQRNCCNINHLFLGTNQENLNDMKNKNRQAKGKQKWSCKLTEEQVLEIRKELQNEFHGIGKYLAQKYNVNTRTISSIKLNKHWKHI